MGHIVFVATANDGATEKDCLFLELSFSLKEIKINIERFVFFFKKNMLKKKSQYHLNLLSLLGWVQQEFNLGGKGA